MSAGRPAGLRSRPSAGREEQVNEGREWAPAGEEELVRLSRLVGGAALIWTALPVRGAPAEEGGRLVGRELPRARPRRS